MPRIDGRELLPGSVLSDAVEVPFRPHSLAREGGGAGVFIETDHRDKRALLWFDTSAKKLMVTYDDVDYTIGP